jgi:hypothetical protein
MATQYYLNTDTRWMSQSGNAILAVTNTAGSEKLINIRNIFIYNNTTGSGGSGGTATTLFLSRATSQSTTDVYGLITPSKMDTSASDWPVDIKITHGNSVVPGSKIVTFLARKALNTSTNYTHMSNVGAQNNSVYGQVWGSRANTNLEKIVVSPTEILALCTDSTSASLSFFYQSIPVQVDAVVILTGTPNRTYNISYITQIIHGSNQSIFSIENDSVSTDVHLVSLTVSEIGTIDSPYFQIVPIGTVDSNALTDSTRALNSKLISTDTATPALSTSIGRVLTDVPILPLGVPVEYISQGSSGTPKGFNYLNTKDFIGPLYSAILPENYTNLTNALTPTNFTGINMGTSSYRPKPTNIVLREGEGIAIVSGAETATATTPVGIAGLHSFEFGLIFDITNAYTPTLTLTGLKTNSEVRIYDAGTITELAGIENSGTSFSWQYDYTLYTSIDIVVHSLGYEYYRIESISIDKFGTTIPIQQRVDRQYLNS